ncbi:hypothetical protein [Agrobacterium leguminum]|uniref:hypothetical protein n=1 Tax=Agrobacterium leguminum TaxID=2792015 RepID=UPI003F741818
MPKTPLLIYPLRYEAFEDFKQSIDDGLAERVGAFRDPPPRAAIARLLPCSAMMSVARSIVHCAKSERLSIVTVSTA